MAEQDERGSTGAMGLRFSKTKLSGVALCALLALGACSEEELVLDGERYEIRAPLPGSEGATGVAGGSVNLTREFRAPATVNHASWTHRGGSTTHIVAHPALNTNLTPIWTANIGKGNSRKSRITSDPVVAGGRIFTLDSASNVVATGSDGASLWSRALVPATDKDGDATGGGLAFADGTVFVTTGFGELFALEATSGAVKWRQKLDAPLTSAPTIDGGLVYVVSRDSQAWALDTAQGRIKWQLPGTPSTAVINGGAGPAIAPRVVVFPFGSGELVGALKKSGIRVWGSSVAGQRKGVSYASISDVTGDPVIVDGVIYAANQAGRLVAMKASSGERIWTAREGSYSPVWPSGDSVFLVSDRNELLRLDRETGERIWGVELPYYTARKLRKRDEIYAHFGPILAGGRLVVASSDGQIRSYDPASGALVGTTALKGGAASAPVIVNSTLYVMTGKGQLAAFR
ncbi:Outer membrane protein assembly factor BamB, contains PQQ-like beta-propeller repeat [Litoreibacter janthinus]|uniref:Outer membrane protein assembly factor BamB, contains PQQ-like beta-propeller repeat n=2 Tax=Litoreibacter janthinus TaxID=670154 RepID=A0A1I6GYZ9_9RHOB|nr:Outer membrane protein assembly factor BamB, contains PQQ-like beta-propeller repeat [Litoreibacter janthinus]